MTETEVVVPHVCLMQKLEIKKMKLKLKKMKMKLKKMKMKLSGVLVSRE